MPGTTPPEIATLSISQAPPTRPFQLPHPATPENIPKENYLLDKFIKTTFNQASPFSTMNSLPAHIHIKLSAKPVT